MNPTWYLIFRDGTVRHLQAQEDPEQIGHFIHFNTSVGSDRPKYVNFSVYDLRSFEIGS